MNVTLLREGIESLDLDADEAQIHVLERYVKEIELWNRRVNLVKAEGDQILIRHVFDCCAGIPEIRQIRPGSILDAGSGAGFPGIILAIFLPEVSVTLLDRSTKRTAFLRNCIAILGLQNCSVVEGELKDCDERYDVVTCRAFRPLVVAFRDLTERLSLGGTLVLYKGKKAVVLEEGRAIEDRAAKYEQRLIGLSVPCLQEERHLLLYRDTTL